VGSIGDAGAFSFNFYKNITAGEGGAVMTSDVSVADRVRIYHDVGIAYREELKDTATVPFSGINYRMDEIRAAMLRVQFRKLDRILGALRKRYAQLRELLQGNAGIELSPVHDLEGICGSALFIRTQSRADSQAFARAAKERKLPVTLPLDTGKHVYSNWDALLARRGAHHPGIDPLHCTEAGRQQLYTPDMLPRTLEHLARTVSIGIDPRWSEQQVTDLARTIRECFAAVPA
jgi:hypothetical protein